MLTREQLIRPRTQVVTLEEGTIVIRALTAGEAFEYRGKDLGREAIFGLLALAICEPTLTAEDIASLPVAVVNEITRAVFTFNALGEKAVAEAADELKKTAPGASISNSP